MNIHILTDIGNVRKENQDNYWSSILEVDGVEVGILCICDGMGGLLNGRLASGAVVRAVREYFLSNKGFDGIIDVLNAVNTKIYNTSNGDLKKAMGTTCTLIMCSEGNYKIYHIGDSRAYLLRGNSFMQLTKDHSAIAEYGISKKTNPKMYAKYKSKLTKCIGAVGDISPDILNGTYQDGDRFLLCSDGCWHYFDDFELNDSDVNDLATLFNKCKNSGETDNITAGLLCI